jgi:anti-sigma-K factor RskA
MSHEDAVGLLGAYALDAVDGDEFAELEEHLETCPRCRSDLDGMREVAAALGNSVEPLPEGLWSNIASRLPERQEDEEPPAMPRLVPDDRTPSRARPDDRGRGRRNALTTVGAIAVAAAAVAAVLGISLVRADNKVSDLQASAARSPAVVTAALHAPGHRVVNLDTRTHAQLARVVVVPTGQGYLVSSSLPALAHGRTYQLWAIEGGQPISVGLLGSAPSRAAFTMAGSTRPSHLSITAEPAGGSVSPTSPIVATGSL